MIERPKVKLVDVRQSAMVVPDLKRDEYESDKERRSD